MSNSHEPVLPGGTEIAAANGRYSVATALAAGAMALAVGAAL